MAEVPRHRDATEIRELVEYWDDLAASYDDGFDHVICGSDEQAVWDRVFTTVTGNRRRLSVLDVGTGTGFLALELAARGHDVVGIDLSPEMLHRARRKAVERELTVRFELGDAERPSFMDETFDLVISRHVFWALTDQSAALERWIRLLRPGGHVAILDGDWCINAPDNPNAHRTPKIDDVRASVETHRFIDVQIDHLADLSEALNQRAAREGRPPDHFQRYLVWGSRPV